MNKIIFSCMLLLLAGSALADPADDWNRLQEQIRDGVIARKAAATAIRDLDKSLFATYSGSVGPSRFHFPVKGYGPASIGGTGGNGFSPSGYDFYDGNRHGGHPAHDLFIRDKNFDSMDDPTGKAVEIIAMEGGVVIGVNPGWDTTSIIRGGVYVWIYSPRSKKYYYYAHLSKALVAPGDRVQAGDRVGLLGRTGKNAYPRRSPTHLHFMCLEFDNGKMTAVNTYRELLGSVVLPR